MQENYIQLTTTQNENIKNADIRREKIITKKGLIITSILLIFVSIFLDLYFSYEFRSLYESTSLYYSSYCISYFFISS